MEKRIILGEHDNSTAGKNQIPKCLIEHIRRANLILDNIFSEEELEIIISHLDQYPLLTKKYADFLLFKEVIDLMKKK